MTGGRLVETWACQPGTERGRSVLLGFHAPSRYLAYCNGKSVVLRSLDDPRQCVVYSDHAHPTTAARISPNGEWVASGDASGSVRVWARGGEHVLRLEVKPFSGSIDDLCWSQDGERIVACGDGKQHFVRAFIWDTGASLGDFDGHSKRVLSCTFRPTRPFRIFTCGEDFAVNFYEGPPFKFKTSNKIHSNFVNCVRSSPNGKLAISVSSDKKGLLFDCQTGQKTGELAVAGAHTGSIYAASWSPDSTHVVTVSADKTAKVWKIAEDGSKGELVTTYSFSASGVEQTAPGLNKPFGPSAPVEYMQVGCAWVDDTIVTISLNSTVNLIPASSVAAAPPLAKATCIQGHAKTVNSMVLGEAGDLYTASYDGTVVRWAGGEGLGVSVKGQSHSNIAGLACAGTTLITVGLDDTMKLTTLPASDFSSSLPAVPLAGQPRSVSAVQDDPSGEQPPLIAVGTAKGLQLFRGPKLLATHAPPFDLAAVALAPSGKQLAVGSASGGTIRLFDVDAAGGQLTEAGDLERHRGPITALAYSPSGALLASGDQNREAVVWECATKEPKLKNLVYHNARISCLAWSSDSSWVATGSLDNSIIVYPVEESASQRVTISGAHKEGLSALLFSRAGRLVSAGLDACLRVWEIK